MEELLGVRLPIFIGMTLILMGGGALMIGQVMASHWKPMWMAVAYAVLLAVGTGFLSLALFYGDPFFRMGQWLHCIAVDAVFHIAYALLAFRVTWVWKMVNQYPWQYEPAGLLGIREKPGQAEP
jgi:hypothetical protein